MNSTELVHFKMCELNFEVNFSYLNMSPLKKYLESHRFRLFYFLPCQQSELFSWQKKIIYKNTNII